MSRHEPDSLSPDERRLAADLARLGPHGAPSARTDAAILNAALVATRGHRATRRSAWWTCAAIPGSLITAFGTAAAFALAVGLVWHLRPADRPPMPQEARGDDVFVAAEMIRAPVATGRTSPEAPPQDARTHDSSAGTPSHPAPSRTLDAERHAGPVMPATVPGGETAMARHATDDDAADPDVAKRSTAAAALRTLPPPAAADAERPVETHAPVAEHAARPRRHATYTSAARARPSARGSDRTAHAPRMPVDAAPPTPLLQGTDGGASPVSAIPVTRDMALDPVAWLERVRQRHRAGDMDAARESLRLFRRAHPRVALPRDLRDPARR